MSSATFAGTVRSGHKGDAVEVPFSPAERWGTGRSPVGPRRLGYQVQASIRGQSFMGQVVARSGRFWLLIPAAIEQSTGTQAGETIEVVLRDPSARAQK